MAKQMCTAEQFTSAVLRGVNHWPDAGGKSRFGPKDATSSSTRRFGISDINEAESPVAKENRPPRSSFRDMGPPRFRGNSPAKTSGPGR